MYLNIGLPTAEPDRASREMETSQPIFPTDSSAQTGKVSFSDTENSTGSKLISTTVDD